MGGGERLLAVRVSALGVDRGRIDVAADARSEDLPRLVPHRHPQHRRRHGRGRDQRRRTVILHLVSFKYKKDTGVSARDDHRARLRALKDLDGVIDLKVGEDIVLTISAPADVKSSLVDRVTAEADAIWRSAGLAITWERQPARASSRTLHVIFGNERGNATSSLQPLGWIRFDDDRPTLDMYL